MVQVQPHTSSGVHVPFRDVLSEAEIAGPFYSCLSKSVDVGHPGKGCDLSEAAFGRKSHP